jgi:predicted transcriptional regulator
MDSFPANLKAINEILGPSSFPECLLELRKTHGLSQKALALAAGMDQSYVAALEKGRRPPPRERQIFRLAEALSASPMETAQLLKARAISNMARSGAQISQPQAPALTHLISIAAGMTPSEVGVLDQIAQALSSLRSHCQCREINMSP